MEDGEGCENPSDVVVVVVVVIAVVDDVAVIVVITSCWTNVRTRYPGCCKGLHARERAEVLL